MPQPSELEVEGTIPTWLTGSLYRGAAATWDTGNYTAEHWFDGFSRNHRFEIANGTVTYRSRNGSDEEAHFVRETGLVPSPRFATDPCKAKFGALETTFRDGSEHPHGSVSTANIPVAWIPNFPGLSRNTTSVGGPFDTLVVTTDSNKLQQIDPVTLEPIELFAYQATDPNPIVVTGGKMSSHPARDSDGSIYNYILNNTASPPVYSILKFEDDTGAIRVLATITDAPAAYIHSVFSTVNYILLVVWQADIVHPATNLIDSLGPWNPDRKTLFYVVDKTNGGVVSKYISDDEAFFAFHEINTFEDETGAINVDLRTKDDLSFIENLRLPNLRANVGRQLPNESTIPDQGDQEGQFRRYHLPFHSRNASTSANGTLVAYKAELVFSLPYAGANIELPQISPANRGRPYRYAYGIHSARRGFFADSLIKIDVDTQEVKLWQPCTPQLPSEPIFVAAPNATSEDDGVLLTVAMDSKVRKSSMVVIDAGTTKEVGRARLPIVMGYGFHGIWGAEEKSN